MDKSNFEDIKEIWKVTGLIVLISIRLHGVTVTNTFRYLDKIRKKR